MSIAPLAAAGRWIERAANTLNPALPAHDFLRQHLLDAHGRLGLPPPELRQTPPDGNQPVGPEFRQALDRAIAELRNCPGRRTGTEVIALSRLLVVQSLLCTERFTNL
jgi:hypothetical protein